MSNIKLQPQSSLLERTALEQRLQKLGLQVGADGSIDPASAKSIKGGVAALESIAKDGVLTLEGAAQLERARFLGFIGRDVSILEQHTSELRSLSLAASGMAEQLGLARGKIESKGLDTQQLDAVTRRAGEVAKRLEPLVKGEANLATTAPDAVRDLASALGQLASEAAAYAGTLSKARVEAFSSGKLDAEGRRTLIKSLLQSSAQLEQVGAIARLVGVSSIGTLEVQARLEAEAEEIAKSSQLARMSGADALVQLDAINGGLAQKNGAIVEQQQLRELERQNNLAELKEKLPSFNRGEAVAKVATFVRERFNPPDTTLPSDRAKVLVLGAFDLPDDKSLPKDVSANQSLELNRLLFALDPNKAVGEQKLVITPNGLRVYGPKKYESDKYTTRVPDAAELANAGWSLERLEAVLVDVAKAAISEPEKLKPIEVRINRTDELHTEGVTSGEKLDGLMKELETALSAPRGKRGDAVVALIESQKGQLSPGEYLDFAIRLTKRTAGTSQGGQHRFRAGPMKLWLYPSEMAQVRDAVLKGAREHPLSVDKYDFMGDHGLQSAMRDLYDATSTHTVSYKALLPDGREFDVLGYQEAQTWSDTIKYMAPLRARTSW